jgi:hypothetical protein
VQHDDGGPLSGILYSFGVQRGTMSGITTRSRTHMKYIC